MADGIAARLREASDNAAEIIATARECEFPAANSAVAIQRRDGTVLRSPASPFGRREARGR
jgi:hypothetical protein